MGDSVLRNVAQYRKHGRSRVENNGGSIPPLISMLYNKLKPEIKRRLHRNSNRYAISIESIINTLKTKKYYNDLTIGEIKQMRSFGDVWSTDHDQILFGECFFNNLNKL